MTFTAEEIDAIVENNEARWNEDDGTPVDRWEFWAELEYHKSGYIPMVGKVTYVDGTGYKEDILEYNGAYSTWRLATVFEVDGRYFRKTGTDDSWDGPGYDQPLEEVHQVEKTITVWETV